MYCVLPASLKLTILISSEEEVARIVIWKMSDWLLEITVSISSLHVFFSIYLKKSLLYQQNTAKDVCSLCGSHKYQKISAALITNINFSNKIVLAKGLN